MSKFNSVFTIVQEHCKKDSLLHKDGMKNVAAKAGITEERLHFYLDCFKDVGVITYCTTKRQVHLTEKGQMTTRIFPN